MNPVDRDILWLDFETTGLPEENAQLLEVACAITGPELEVLKTVEMVIRQPDEVLNGMNDWCKKTHGASGLIQAVRERGMPLPQVEEELLVFVGGHFGSGATKILLAGNTVGTFDRHFIVRDMPKLNQKLHYRHLDVSAFKEWFWRKYGLESPKRGAHRALLDIQESIKELRYFNGFIKHPERAQ